MVECIEIRELARELNVSIRVLRDLVRAGHLELRGEDYITRDSADELRWTLACARADRG